MKKESVLDGIILRRFQYGEADRFITFFTLQEGKVRVLAKGVRKMKSRFGGHLELFQRVIIHVHKGKNTNTLTGIQPIYVPFSFENQLESMSAAYTMAELVDRFMQESEENPTLFHMILRYLQALMYHKNQKVLIEAFKIQLLWHIGLLPEFHKCLFCKSKFTEISNLFFYGESNGFCCDCTDKDLRDCIRLSFNQMKLCNYFQKSDFFHILPVAVQEEDMDLLTRITGSILSKYFDKALKTEQFGKILS